MTSDDAGHGQRPHLRRGRQLEPDDAADRGERHYDDASELTSSSLSGTTTDYSYDASGNRTGESVGGTSTVSGTYDGAEQLTSYSNSAADMTAATYDGDGLRTSAASTPTGGSSSTQNFVWDTTSSVPELLMDSTNAYIYGSERDTLRTGQSLERRRSPTSSRTPSVRFGASSAATGSLTASHLLRCLGQPRDDRGTNCQHAVRIRRRVTRIRADCSISSGATTTRRRGSS